MTTKHFTTFSLVSPLLLPLLLLLSVCPQFALLETTSPHACSSEQFECQKSGKEVCIPIAKKCDDNRKKSQIEPEPDEIEPFLQETDVDITGTVLKKFGKHRTVHDVIVPGELC